MNRHRFFSTCGNYVYHIAIIDYLTEFTFQKQGESFWKTTMKNNKQELVSAIHPTPYGNRFIEFMNKEVIINEESKRKTNSKLTEAIKNDSFKKMKEEFDNEVLNSQKGDRVNA